MTVSVVVVSDAGQAPPAAIGPSLTVKVTVTSPGVLGQVKCAVAWSGASIVPADAVQA